MIQRDRDKIDFMALFVIVMTIVIFIGSIIAILAISSGCQSHIDPKACIGGMYCNLSDPYDAGT